MKQFAGFPDGPVRMTPLPGIFFTQLLPQIDHLGEFKITLYAFWVFSRQEGSFHYVSLGAMQKDNDLLAALAGGGKSGGQALQDALERAVARGTLIAVRASSAEATCFFLNSPHGRAAAAALERGEWKPDESSVGDLWEERPNLFTLYEQNIGALTPMLAEVLRDAEKEYPAAWIEEAIREAVEHNARSWKYIAAILERWKKEGKGGGKPPSEEDRKRYVEGEYADFIEH
jgi:DnaD/phage-associated family protein